MPEVLYENYEGEINFSNESDETLLNIYNELKANAFKFVDLNKTENKYFYNMQEIVFNENKEFYDGFACSNGYVCACDVKTEIIHELAKRYIKNLK